MLTNDIFLANISYIYNYTKLFNKSRLHKIAFQSMKVVNDDITTKLCCTGQPLTTIGYVIKATKPSGTLVRLLCSVYIFVYK